MIEPRLESEAERREMGKTLAEGAIGQQSLRRRITGIEYDRVGVPGDDVTDAAEAVAAGAQRRPQQGLPRGAEPQISEADDAGTDFRAAVAAARAHRGHAVDEFGLADRPHRLGPAGTVH